MCSVFGIINYRSSQAEARALALRQSHLLSHRGPDSYGVYSCDRAVLVHNRISIIDVFHGGQPLLDAAGKVALVANAEIYNHRDIREALTYPYKTDSDCESILALYKQKGVPFLEDLNGMFAFILYDSDKSKFLIARDHIGIMSLFYGYDEQGTLYVASEMKALLSVCCHIEFFPPGHYLSSDDCAPIPYYQRDWQRYENVMSNRTDKQKLKLALEEAIERQLMSDVPFGLLLSGGLDSSIIAATAVDKLRKQSASGATNICGFSVGLEGSPDISHARVLAKHLDIPHFVHVYSIEEGLDAIRNTIYHVESYDVTTVRAAAPMYIIARKIRANGIKMVLTGEGSDEVFGGYLYFHKAPDARAFHQECVRKLSRLHLYDCLRANKTMLAWGVEPRVPFLDKEFLDVAMRINPKDKMCSSSRMEKHVLRECFADVLPESIVWRQKEQFSDGVGYDWISTLKAVAAAKVTDAMLAVAKHTYPHNTPNSKEAYMYRAIFDELFPHRCAALCAPETKSAGNATEVSAQWMGSALVDDPSGRAVVGVHANAFALA